MRSEEDSQSIDIPQEKKITDEWNEMLREFNFYLTFES